MSTDLDRIDELLDDQEAAFREAFRVYVATVGSQPVVAAIIVKLEARDFEGAMAIVDSYVNRFGDVIPRIAQAVGDFTAAELSGVIARDVPEIVTGISFDPSFPRAAEIVQEHRLAFVRDFSATQREATLQALTRSFNEGTGPIATARVIRQSIGLTAQQEGWVDSYRKTLTENSQASLRRDLRDRRFDKRVETALRRNRPMTDLQIDTAVERYRQNALQMRAETIARTEGTQAAGEARDEAVDQMIEQTGIDPARIDEMWNATRDKRTRDHHASMNGQVQRKGIAFIDGLGNKLMRPGDPAAPAITRINCRCTKTFSVRPAA